ncbi:hypothetical protein [Zhongshania sp. BJYM1]|uniref:hypothetical protein n=1 Tax=Zhongshania aquatica TaxID=2965069 RepID=UPI0022B3B784|nr:hypothetical protein [Marortus sp. BJYM1]
MATYTAVCIEGTFVQSSTLGGQQIRCTGTLENREYASSYVQDLSANEVQDLTGAVLVFFTVCAVVRFVVRFVAESSPSRGG